MSLSLPPIRFISAIVVSLAVLAATAEAAHVESDTKIAPKHGSQIVIPMMDAERGKQVFIDKGCVACHAVNGIGGHDAPAMDAHRKMGLVNPFDFAAKMWNHAPGMIAAQEAALGEQIYFTGQDLADIIAFVHDDEAQHRFGERDLTPNARKMMQHDHGNQTGPAAHAREVGHGGHHGHAPGTKPHKD